MSETFFIKYTNFDDFSNDISLREDTSFVIGPGELDGPGGRTRNSDLELYGFGALKWGEGVDQNLFRMLENNACPQKALNTPVDETDLGEGNGITTPVLGQTWFNTTDEELYMFITGGWSRVTATTSSSGTAALDAHAADDSLHLTSDQNTFLDGLDLPTLVSAEANFLVGVTSLIQVQLDSMVEKAGDVMTGDLRMDTGNITLDTGGQLWFESGDSRITNNDGGGNFNIRVGNYYDGGAADELYNQTGQGAVHLNASHESGLPTFTVKVSEDSANAVTGQPVVWTSSTAFKSDGNVTVSAPTPLVSADLTRKDYVDTQIADNVAAVLDVIYPVGSLYVTFNSTLPTALNAIGTWTQTLRGRFLVGEGTSDQLFTAGGSGGESTHQLSVAEMPSHNHGGGSHNHSLVMGGGSSGPRKAIAIDTSNNSSHGYTGTTNATGTKNNVVSSQGSNSSHNNLPPYQTTYIFTRTA